MSGVSFPERMARASARRPWTTVAAWVVALGLGVFVVSGLLSGVLTNEVQFNNSPESVRAQEAVEERLRETPATELFIVRSDGVRFSHPEFRAKMQALQADVMALGPGVVESAFTFFDTGDRSLISIDEQATMMPVVLAGSIDDAEHHAEKIRGVAHAASADGYRVLVVGNATMFADFTTMADEDLRRGETIGILAALVILILVFGAVVAALVPIGLGIAAILLAIAMVALVGQAFDFTFFVVNMITMMGLAVGIDYSLFIVSRYREERADGAEKLDAVAIAGRTASRAVLFSGMTVVLALAGMLIIPTSVFQSVALGAIFAVVFAVAASMTLLPAILSLLGDKVNALRIHRRKTAHGGHRFWDWAARRVMARPVVSLVLSAGLLMGAGAFYFQMDTGFSGVSTMPAEMESRQAFEELATNFAGGATAPIEIAVVADDVMAPEIQLGVQDLRDELAADPGFGPSAIEVNEQATLALVSAPVVGDPSSEAAMASVVQIREEYVPRAFADAPAAEVLVGGESAFSKDFIDQTDFYMPIVLAFVLFLSFLLLTVAFRSIVVPFKAILMNLLSVGAAYGLIVMVFQKGWGAGLFGFTQVEAIEPWLPLFLFSVLFGLSMDYHVFLLSRIREHFDRTGDNTESVAHGLRSTGRIITGAALIMVAVFAGFAAGEMVSFQQMGFGLGVAVLLDATLVRSVLVPSTMKLLGNRNWYLPRWLEWLPHVTVEAGPAEAERKVQERPLVGSGT